MNEKKRFWDKKKEEKLKRLTDSKSHTQGMMSKSKVINYWNTFLLKVKTEEKIRKKWKSWD